MSSPPPEDDTDVDTDTGIEVDTGGWSGGKSNPWRGFIRRHDPFFKWALDQPGVPEALAHYCLPEPLALVWTGEPLNLIQMSPVSKKLHEFRTDRAFSCPVRPDGPVGLLVIFEHKSRPFRGVGWQVLGYMVEAIQGWLAHRPRPARKHRHRLPAVTAIVIYHGKGRWNVPLSLAGMVSPDQTLWSHVPNFHIGLLDVLRIPDDRLPTDPRLRALFLIWQADRQHADFKTRLTALARTALGFSLDDLTAMVYYLLKEFDENDSALLGEVLAEVMPGRKERLMQSVGDRLIALGEARGEARGEIRGEARGVTKGKAGTLLRLLRRRFKTLPKDAESRVTGADGRQLDTWLDAMIDAPSPEDVFRERPN